MKKLSKPMQNCLLLLSSVCVLRRYGGWYANFASQWNTVNALACLGYVKFDENENVILDEKGIDWLLGEPRARPSECETLEEKLARLREEVANVEREIADAAIENHGAIVLTTGDNDDET